MLNVSDFEKARTEIVRKENKIEAAKIEQKDLKKERVKKNLALEIKCLENLKL